MGGCELIALWDPEKGLWGWREKPRGPLPWLETTPMYSLLTTLSQWFQDGFRDSFLQLFKALVSYTQFYLLLHFSVPPTIFWITLSLTYSWGVGTFPFCRHWWRCCADQAFWGKDKLSYIARRWKNVLGLSFVINPESPTAPKFSKNQKTKKLSFCCMKPAFLHLYLDSGEVLTKGS